MRGKILNDKPTPERLAKAGDDFEEVVTSIIDANGNVDEKLTLRLLDGSVLDRLLSRKSITTDQYIAGARFFLDYDKAQFSKSGVVDPTREHVDGGRSDLMSDQVLDAARRYRLAVQAVGLIHSTALIEIILLEHSLVDYGRKHHRKTDENSARIAGLADFSSGLKALDFYYYGKRDNPTRASHETDYRPKIV